MEVFIILGIVILASVLAKRAPAPSTERIDTMETRLNEIGEQVADFLIDDK